MSLALRGHSKFKVRRIGQVVHKSAPSDGLFERLDSEAVKQEQSPYEGFIAPRILSKQPDQRLVTMEFLPFLSVPEFFTMAVGQEMTWFIDKLEHYLKWIDRHAVKMDFNYGLYRAKLSATFANIYANKSLLFSTGQLFFIRDVMEDWLTRLETIDGGLIDKHGWCHGDFTFSNLIVDPWNREIYWFDFLTGWDHSIYVDLAKLEQEFAHAWSLRFLRFGLCVDRGVALKRTKQVQDALGPLFSGQFDGRVLALYKAINDLRLLQYERDSRWGSRILNHLKDHVICN
jgi:hypothetical protein